MAKITEHDKLKPKPRFIKEGGKLYIKETFFMSCLLTAITIFFLASR